LEKEDPGTVIFHEWKAIGEDLRKPGLGWREKLGYLFGPPGWSHDGSRKTSEELREIESA
jgi:hypothetical protein